MSGDYEFLSRMYISGGYIQIIHSYVQFLGIMYMRTLGRHPCLWSTINSDEASQRGAPAVAPRTLDSLQADLLLFQTSGNGDLKQAKKINNVIGQYFFKIPLTQVTTAT